MKVSDKRILIILSAFLFIFIATSILEAINRKQAIERNIERLQMEKERHQMEKKLHQMRMEEFRQQSKSKKK